MIIILLLRRPEENITRKNVIRNAGLMSEDLKSEDLKRVNRKIDTVKGKK